MNFPGGSEKKAPGLLVVSHHVLTKCDVPHSRGQKPSAAVRRFFAYYVVRPQR